MPFKVLLVGPYDATKIKLANQLDLLQDTRITVQNSSGEEHRYTESYLDTIADGVSAVLLCFKFNSSKSLHEAMGYHRLLQAKSKKRQYLFVAVQEDPSSQMTPTMKLELAAVMAKMHLSCHFVALGNMEHMQVLCQKLLELTEVGVDAEDIDHHALTASAASAASAQFTRTFSLNKVNLPSNASSSSSSSVVTARSSDKSKDLEPLITQSVATVAPVVTTYTSSGVHREAFLRKNAKMVDSDRPYAAVLAEFQARQQKKEKSPNSPLNPKS